MAKILITGAGGYIGSVATYLFLQNGYEVVGVDNFSRGFRRPLEVLQEKYGKEKLRIYEADLQGDISQIFDLEKEIQAVVHYAALCSVDESMKHPARYFENNVRASLNVLEAMVKHQIVVMVFSSTCTVYDNAHYIPIDEKHPLNPQSPYGESKRMAEKTIEWYGQLKGVRFVILRYFNVAGASDDGLIGDAKKPSVHLIQNAVRGALGLEPFFLTYQSVETTPDHSPIRDYTNVVDLNEAHLKAIEYLLKGGTSEVINLGTGRGNSVLEVVQKVEAVTGKKLNYEKGASREGEADRMIAAIEKAKQVLGWEPKRSIEDSIKSLVAWYGKRPQGWEK